jgi:hypothetical protein
MSTEETRQDWSEWLQHPATRAFFAHIQGEWGTGGQRFDGLMNKLADSTEEDRKVLDQIRQVAVCKREIARLVQWPSEELARLKRQDVKPEGSYRPELHPMLAGESRRGGL